jgi:hypothetical protein
MASARVPMCSASRSAAHRGTCGVAAGDDDPPAGAGRGDRACRLEPEAAGAPMITTVRSFFLYPSPILRSRLVRAAGPRAG